MLTRIVTITMYSVVLAAQIGYVEANEQNKQQSSRKRAKEKLEGLGCILENPRELLETLPEHLRQRIDKQIPPGIRTSFHGGWKGGDDDLRLLSIVGDVYSVSLRSPLITDKSLDVIVSMQGISAIHIGECNISQKSLTSLQKLDSLQRISLETAPISDQVCTAIASLPELRELEILNARDVSADGLACLLSSSSLTNISFSNLHVDARSGRDNFKDVANDSVSSIYLCAGRCDVKALVAFCSQCRNLKTLQVRGVEFLGGNWESLRQGLPHVTIHYESNLWGPVRNR